MTNLELEVGMEVKLLPKTNKAKQRINQHGSVGKVIKISDNLSSHEGVYALISTADPTSRWVRQTNDENFDIVRASEEEYLTDKAKLFMDEHSWWYDYSSLLIMMKTWLDISSKKFKEGGISTTSSDKAKVMHKMSLLIDRIVKDDYINNMTNNKVFKSRRRLRKTGILYGQQRDVEYLFKLFNKHLLGMWD